MPRHGLCDYPAYQISKYLYSVAFQPPIVFWIWWARSRLHNSYGCCTRQLYHKSFISTAAHSSCPIPAPRRVLQWRDLRRRARLRHGLRMSSGGHPCANSFGLTWLWQQCPGWPSGLLGTTTAVTAERGCAVDLSVYHLRRSDHISDALACLHWLRVPERIEFKIAVLTYKVVHGLAPGYLGPFTRITDQSSRNRLIVSTSRLSTVGSRAFPVTGPQTWNNLPEDMTSAESLTTFRRLLKRHLFRKSFPDYLLDINWLSSVDLPVVLLLRPPKNYLIDWLIDLHPLQKTCFH